MVLTKQNKTLKRYKTGNEGACLSPNDKYPKPSIGGDVVQRFAGAGETELKVVVSGSLVAHQRIKD